MIIRRPYLAILLAITACDTGTEPITVSSVSVTPGSVALESGGTVQLSARVMGSTGTALQDRPVAWNSSDPAVAQVSSTGLVTGAMNRGAASVPVTITATVEGKSGTAAVELVPAPARELRLTPDTLRLIAGESAAVTAQVLDATGQVLSGRAIQWRTSDTTVVTVSDEGLLSAALFATSETRIARITGVVDGQSDSLLVQVTPLPASTLEFGQPTLRLAESDTIQLGVTVRAADGTELRGREILWAFDDTTVIKRLDDGRLVATPYAGDQVRTTTITAQVDQATASLEAEVFVDWDRWQTFWEIVPDGMPVLSDVYAATGGQGVTMRTVVLDMNGDGRDDLFVQMWSVVVGGARALFTEEPILDRIVLLVSEPDGRMRDATFEILGRTDVSLGVLGRECGTGCER